MKYPDDISEEIKTKRIVRLNEIQNDISFMKNKAKIGEIETVYIEVLRTKKSENEIQGRTDCNRIVILDKGPEKIGDKITVKITEATRNVLKGIRVN